MRVGVVWGVAEAEVVNQPQFDTVMHERSQVTSCAGRDFSHAALHARPPSAPLLVGPGTYYPPNERLRVTWVIYEAFGGIQ